MKDISDKVLDAACRGQWPGWDKMRPDVQRKHRSQMRIALFAAFEAYGTIKYGEGIAMVEELFKYAKIHYQENSYGRICGYLQAKIEQLVLDYPLLRPEIEQWISEMKDKADKAEDDNGLRKLSDVLSTRAEYR